MNILIKSAKIVHYHEVDPQPKDILIQDGKISAIGENLAAKDAEVVEFDDLHVSPGFTDLNVFCGEPGLEHQEDMQSLSNAAVKGGFTTLVTLPNTVPAVDNKAQLLYVRGLAANLPVTVHPAAALTKGAKGDDIAELLDMHQHGAQIFTNGDDAIDDAGLLQRSLQYVKPFGGTVAIRPDDRGLSAHAVMNESMSSTMLGLNAAPAIAESINLYKAVEMLRYTQGQLLVQGVSTKSAVDLIRSAKAEGLNIKASVNVYSLCFTQEALADFDTNLKVQPFLRGTDDVAALTEALIDGTIDCISAAHRPQEQELKLCEFEQAGFGMIGLESAFGALGSALKPVELTKVIQALAYHPKQLLNKAMPKIEEGAPADLSLFQPQVTYRFSLSDIKSKSKNTPFINQELKGKICGIVSPKSGFVHA